MYFAAATEPGTPGTPNEDWAGATGTAAVVLDGVTTFGDPGAGCRHGTPWYVTHLGTRILAEMAHPGVSLETALAHAIGGVAALHSGLCDLSDVAAPSAAVAMVRLGDAGAEYLVLSDVTVLVDHATGISVITDDRVAATVSDLTAPGAAGSEVMERRRRYRNTEGGYWVAAADPAAARHAVTGRFPLAEVRRIVLLTDGASRLVTPFGWLGWDSLVALAEESGPSAVIERARSAEAADPECRRWPRFKMSDDATIAVLVPGSPARRKSPALPREKGAEVNVVYVRYIRNMSENALPLPYEVQEMTTTEARKHLPELVNMAAYGHVTTVLVRDGHRLARIVPEEDAWIYSPAWQDKLREAEADVAAGRVRRFHGDDDFLAHLENLGDEVDG